MPDFSKSLQKIRAVSRASGPSDCQTSGSDNTARKTYDSFINVVRTYMVIERTW